MNKRIRKKHIDNRFKSIVTFRNSLNTVNVKICWLKKLDCYGFAGFMELSSFPGMIFIHVSPDSPGDSMMSACVGRMDYESDDCIVYLTNRQYQGLWASNRAERSSAYFILLHGIGHVVNGDPFDDEDELESKEFERTNLCREGKVEYGEFLADYFAATVIGFDKAIKALRRAADEDTKRIKFNSLFFDEDYFYKSEREMYARVALLEKSKEGQKIEAVITELGTMAV